MDTYNDQAPGASVSLRIVVIDDHLIVLDGLRRVIEAEPGWQVVATCRSAAHALAVLAAEPVDLVVVDWRMPEMSGLDFIRRVRADGLKLAIVVLTADISDEDLAEALRQGVNGIVLKEQAPIVLLDCIRAVAGGDTYIVDDTLKAAFDRIDKQDVAREGILQVLTPREIEVARLAAVGLRSKEIGAELGITLGTVKLHLHSIYSKLDIATRVELANLSQRLNLTPDQRV